MNLKIYIDKLKLLGYTVIFYTKNDANNISIRRFTKDYVCYLEKGNSVICDSDSQYGALLLCLEEFSNIWGEIESQSKFEKINIDNLIKLSKMNDK